MAWQSSVSGRSGQPPPKRQRPLSSGSQDFLSCDHEEDLVAAFRRELEAKYSPAYEFYLACPFAKHNPGHYENVKNVCTEGWGFKNIGKLKEHINRVHTRSHGCDDCKQRFTSLTEKQKHANKSCDKRDLTDEDPEWMTVAQTEAWAVLDCRGRGDATRSSQKETRGDAQRDKAAAAAAAHKWKAMIYACLFPNVDENARPDAFHKPGLVTVNFVIDFLTKHQRGPRLSEPNHHGGEMSLIGAGLHSEPAYHPVGGNTNSTATSTPMTGHFPLDHGWQKPDLAAGGVSYSQPTTAYATDGSLDFGDGREEDMAAMNLAFRQHAAAAAAAPAQTGPQTPRLTRGVLKSHASSLPPPPFPYYVSHGPDSGYKSGGQEAEAAAADAAAAAASKADEDAASIIPADDLMWPHGGLEPDLMRFFRSEEFMAQVRGEHLELSDAEADDD